MPKFYLTDGPNQFLIDTNTEIQACQKAIEYWENQEKEVGKLIYFGNNGFKAIKQFNRLETKIVKGING